MIISDLQAEYFRKYQTLQLHDLPAQGLVIIAGGNESGKSSIGEAICFALFGRTDVLPAVRTQKLVHWAGEQATVSLAFQHKGQHYRLTRKVDKAGNQSAVLWDPTSNTALANTPIDVDKQVLDILGYGYPAFARAFYWGQQANPDGQTDADSLQAMAGIKRYARLDKELQQEQEEIRAQIEQQEADHHTTLAARDALNLHETRLPDLLEVQETVEDQQHRGLRLVQEMQASSPAYPANHQSFQRFQRRSQWLGWWSLLGVLALLLVLGIWGIMTFLPHRLADIRLPTFASESAFPSYLLWLGVLVAAVTSVLFLWGWHVERNRLQPLRKQADTFGNTLDGVLATVLDNNHAWSNGKTGQYLQDRHLLPDSTPALPDTIIDLPARIRSYRATPADVASLTDTTTRQLQQQSNHLGDVAAVLNEDVQQERLLAAEFSALNKQATETAAQMEANHQQIQVREKAVGLLRQASTYAIERFNQIVHNRCQGLLAEFTQAHYHNLEIKTDFALRVLSEEKGDYLEFDEISAGTQRQITLAMRIALANSLAESTDTDQQLLFLDEPFAFFDAERTAATLGSLRETSKGRLSQIWLTAQTAPEQADAYIVQCSKGEATLIV